ncbi:MAG TPA: hypothetical protein DEG17_26480 [Cyanobacteria bacterium UBA11149]|nr:hypothetical protein [Cyanobacteria bacterium UBA11367]HBE59710.1 hypothetical protein [Cyanobacteria bacterium UBA11366]HBK62896.1 hypothetical protein [Cyanobacteria bacterium UBA11166]HBR76065.1 hypothetical protein [Cyanobacteria bacterium UBA11159]HBS72666.1 hypothetical protein [Cyanobacteria bacterium UBA11153]HBW92316.1 hypothetical protein [Cyanobacteria bacterium UBA11149]HCA96164.1 hypothetical protein [Cyanobacteria bacterium UBA9226]
MLFATEIINKSPVERLVSLWSKRYNPDLSSLSIDKSKIMSSDLIKTASLEGREETIAKLKRLVEINCKCAGIQTSALFSYIPNIVNLWESQRIAQLVGQIYDRVLDVYLQQSPSPQLIAEIREIAAINFSDYPQKASTIPGLEISAIKQLSKGLEGLYQELRQQYLSSRDSRAIGFMSTQFHLSSRLLINRMTVWERLFISPYFKFVEEQVCIPWQRVCIAATKHEINSPALGIVQQLLPVSLDIAKEVHRQAVRLNPNHRSLRGTLDAPDVRASSIRDVEMFQGYLWLCVLEGNTSSVEQELLPLCKMVFPSINVTWELVEQLLPLLVAEIQLRVKPEQMNLVQPYTEAMEKLFSVAG